MIVLKQWVWRTALFVLLFPVVWVLVYKWVNPPITFTMLQRKSAAWRAGEPSNLKRNWKPLTQISDQMVLAVMATEDQNFPFHYGFDFNAIKKAAEYNRIQAQKGKKRLKGGSTISQQVAKNVFLWERRSWFRKGLETYFTLLIELLWGKQRIMEVYLNVAETGKRCFGVEAAAQLYFGKKAAVLTQEQAALIAAILPAPQKNNPAKPGKLLANRKTWAMKQMYHLEKEQYMRFFK
ncbi:MAG TPA: monofunctional biosynthetic peptidoglycan transglycosylase [Chitinophagales bacterium]|nr:monofunctional biosynthetic peptidoglycan transglycosylase [Chitinophagales bacterium]HRK26985.1 monofunctional biosynthetic peptidoglycan transglycosylase [Chitinophagales bacterium]